MRLIAVLLIVSLASPVRAADETRGPGGPTGPYSSSNGGTLTVLPGGSVIQPASTAAVSFLSMVGGTVVNGGSIINTNSNPLAIIFTGTGSLTNQATGVINGNILFDAEMGSNFADVAGTFDGKNGTSILSDSIEANANGVDTFRFTGLVLGTAASMVGRNGTGRSDITVGQGGQLIGGVFNEPGALFLRRGTVQIDGVVRQSEETADPLTSLGVSASERMDLTVGTTGHILSPGTAVRVQGISATAGSSVVSRGRISGTAAAISLAGQNDTVVLGNGSVTGGDVDGGAGTDSLTLDGAGTLAGSVRSFESLLKSSAGNFDYSGTMNIAGAVQVAGGVLRLVSGSILSAGNVTVGANGTMELAAGTRMTAPAFTNNGVLKGNGTYVGNVTNNGRFAPGQSIGTTPITGNLALANTGVLEIEVANGASDLVTVSGTTTLDGALQIVPLERIRAPQTYTFLTSAGITGQFATITGFSSAVLTSQVVNTGTALTLTLGRNTFASLALGNQAPVAQSLDAFIAGGSASLLVLTDALDALPSRAAVGAALEQLHPEPYDAHKQIAFTHNQQYAGAMEQYLRSVRLQLEDPKAERTQAFAQIYSFEGDQNTLGGATVTRTGYEYASRGAMMGVDRKVRDDLAVGLAAGFGDITADYRAGLGRIDGDTYQFGPYATWAHGKWYADALATYTNFEYDTLRNIAFPGFSAVSRANDHDAETVSGYVGGGWITRDDGWSYGPTASLQFTRFDADAFVETGSVAALAVAGRDVDSVRSQLGVRVAKNIRRGSTLVLPEVRLRWAHELSDDDRAIRASFASGGAPAFTVLASRPDRDSAYLGASVSVLGGKTVDGYVSYDADLGREGASVHSVRGGLAVKF
jgi:uncharacterized protein with beta-barrel porin domain